jgi:hypothetical protein
MQEMIYKLLNCRNTYLLTHVNKDQKRIIIKEILKRNGYQQQITNQKFKHNCLQGTQKTKWATSTYYGLDTRTIKNYFETKPKNSLQNHQHNNTI